MDISLLVDTSGIPVNQNERKPLDGKACFDGSYDEEEYWYCSGKDKCRVKNVESRNSSYNASNAAKTITINVIGDEEEEMTTGIRQLQITNDELPVYDLIGVTLS